MQNNEYVKLANDIVKYNKNITELATNSLIALYKASPNHFIADKDFVKGYKKLHDIIEKVEDKTWKVVENKLLIVHKCIT